MNIRVNTSAALAAVAVCAGALAAGADAQTGALYQHLTLAWSHGRWHGHDRATFQIPGVGNGNVVCSPGTTWIQMVPADRDAENDMWSVLFQKKHGLAQTAVKQARVYQFSTPTSTVPHGTGPTAFEGFNEQTPIERQDSGSLIGLISRRAALDEPAGAGSAATAVRLSWSWSGFHTAAAQCRVQATFVTPIAGRSRFVSEGVRSAVPARLGAVSSFNMDWHGTSDYGASTRWPHTLTIPGVGRLDGVCQPGAEGAADLTLAPEHELDPFAAITTYQGQGTEASELDDYRTSPGLGALGPIPLPVNGFVAGNVLPAWDASASRGTEILASSIRKTNDPDSADDYCQVSVEAIGAPDPLR